MKFEFKYPTHLIFGAGTLAQLGEVVSKHGKKALIVTGGGITMDASKVPHPSLSLLWCCSSCRGSLPIED